MKKTILISFLFSVLFSAVSFAQETAVELYNAGNTAYKTKDFKTALAKWEAYLAHPDAAAENTESTTYYVAEASRLSKDIDKARTYYQKCVDLNYKADMCMFKLGSTYKTEDPAKYISIMEKCVKDYPNSKYYKKYFLGSVTSYYNKEAAAIFNKANSEAQTASASTETYVETMKAKVLPMFDQAEAAFNKTLSFDAANPAATGAIANIKAQRDAFAAYEAQLAAQKK